MTEKRKRPTIAEERSFAYDCGYRAGLESAQQEFREMIGKVLGVHDVLERLRELESTVDRHEDEISELQRNS